MRTPRIVDLLREINLFKGLVEGVRRLRAEGAVKTRVGKGSDDLHGERGQPPFRQLAAVAETMPALPLGPLQGLALVVGQRDLHRGSSSTVPGLWFLAHAPRLPLPQRTCNSGH